jgi:hypothetical protein
MAFASQPAKIPLNLPATGNGFADGKDQYWQASVEGKGDWQAAIAANPGLGSLDSPNVRDTSISRWIRYRRGHLPDRTRYLFRTTVTLDQLNSAKVQFFIRHSADDLLDEVYLNGRSVWRETEAERSQPYANSDRFQDLELELPCNPGDNTLTFYVLNADTAYPDRDSSGMMFRAEIDAIIHRPPLGF